MKIDIESIRKKKQEKEEQSKKEFEDLKRKMDAAKAAGGNMAGAMTSPMIERSVKFSGGPKVESITNAMKVDEGEVAEEVQEEP